MLSPNIYLPPPQQQPAPTGTDLWVILWGRTAAFREKWEGRRLESRIAPWTPPRLLRSSFLARGKRKEKVELIRWHLHDNISRANSMNISWRCLLTRREVEGWNRFRTVSVRRDASWESVVTLRYYRSSGGITAYRYEVHCKKCYSDALNHVSAWFNTTKWKRWGRMVSQVHTLNNHDFFFNSVSNFY